MQGHKVHTVLGVQAHHIHKILGSKLGKIALIVDHRVIHRHGADHGRALGGELLAERLGVAVAGKIHNGLGAHFHGAHHLLHFNVVILAVARYAQVYIDLGAQHTANALRVQALVMLVGRNGHLALGHQRANFFGGAVFFLGHSLHFGGDDALAGGVHLGGIALHGGFSFPYDPCENKKTGDDPLRHLL